jgi:hypothetical protein
MVWISKNTIVACNMSLSAQTIKEPILFSPAEIGGVIDKNKGFNIPIYQRLYAWGKNEIEKLLKDVLQAWSVDTAKEYYLGNLTLSVNKISGYLDIIDGQQRMTTLWLIGLVLDNKIKDNRWQHYLKNEHGTLLRFTAREDDNHFLKALVERNDVADFEFGQESKINKMMVEAIKIISLFLDSKEVKLDEFSKFIYTKVKLAAIYLPDNIDLNKYFEDMNNRGLQLELHHILKADLLEHIDTNLQESYAAVWDAISQMNQYIEYGFNDTLRNSREKILNQPHSFFGAKSDNSGAEKKTLKGLIIDRSNVEANNKTPNAEKQPVDKVTSIVSFPEFLLHCLRLYKNDSSFNNEPSTSVDDKKLGETFKKHLFEGSSYNKNFVKEFIEYLFKCRVAFDKYFIKSLNNNEGTRWEIRDIELDEQENSSERKKHLEGKVVQIQSMLMVSTSASQWLTKALQYALEDNVQENDFFNRLEALDRELHPVLPADEELNRGVLTNRYWFYKLDYLLWKKWTNTTNQDRIPQFKEIDHLKDKIRNFQFRDNRSVEHIHPRNPEFETWLSTEDKNLVKLKDQFGNLALISISSNSSYKNQSTINKKLDFIKRTRNWGIESLKLVAVYSIQEWTIEAMETHQQDMINILQDAYR